MKRFLTACAALVCMTAPALAGWQRLPSLPEANGGFACGFIAGKLIIAGGTLWQNDQKHWLSAIRCYDPQTEQWSTLGQLPHPWAYGACGVIHDHLILAGGSDGKSGLRDILAIDASGRCQPCGNMAKGLIYTNSAVCGEQLIFAGGATDPADLGTFTSDAFLLTITPAPLHATVRALPSLSGKGFGTGTAAASENKVFIFGGAHHDPVNVVQNIDTLHVIDQQGSALTTNAHLPTPIRGITAITLTEGLIYLAGGYPGDDAGFTDEAWLFDASTQTFAKAKALPLKSMVHLTRGGEWIYALGGEDKKKHRTAGMWRIRVEELKSPGRR